MSHIHLGLNLSTHEAMQSAAHCILEAKSFLSAMNLLLSFNAQSLQIGNDVVFMRLEPRAGQGWCVKD